ncbi:outer membrane autotransporter [Paraburkholderia sediminicola]|uniref:hypothetical protein n=1 Tax=Paraburkholderia sediminicola TaxID=458836 RepID=UPI0038B7C47A
MQYMAAFRSNPSGCSEGCSTTAECDLARLALGGIWQASEATSVFRGKVAGEAGGHMAGYGPVWRAVEVVCR